MASADDQMNQMLAELGTKQLIRSIMVKEIAKSNTVPIDTQAIMRSIDAKIVSEVRRLMKDVMKDLEAIVNKANDK